MNIIKATFTPQYWALPKDIALIFGYKSPTKLLTSFRAFCDSRPNYFNPTKPYRELEGTDTIYNVYAFAHYFENRQLLDAGTRSLKFENDLPRLVEAYSLHLLKEESL
ncbi:hypothetical protein FEZ33_01375 [Ruoffia tabacinasalis]|uniref:Uncharacterized protein n=1 Tax=Ruoffia tabacinasalis TaxID=87458 RepID=A0A5R9EPA4_9LACT|nr:hypothetical protein [Ruoffia tabacinasalis]TLQ49310.1 hypothetical protein FEZ33_01375 [Ruoffia tabacinasalis]